MNIFTLIADVCTNIVFVQVVAVLTQIYIANTEHIKRIMIATFLFNLFNMLCYFLQGDMMTVYMYILIVVRSFVYIEKDKLDKYTFIPIGFIIIQTIVGLTTLQYWYNILAIIIPCYTIYYMWFYKTTQKLRVGNIVSASLWFAYNIITGLYIISISRVITVAVNAIALRTHRKELREEIC